LWGFGGMGREERTYLGTHLSGWMRIDVLWQGLLLFLFQYGHGFDICRNPLLCFAWTSRLHSLLYFKLLDNKIAEQIVFLSFLALVVEAVSLQTVGARAEQTEIFSFEAFLSI
jgi:hypothetical protein